MNGPELAVRCDNVVHVYGEAGAEVVALRGVDLEVRRGETLAVLGPSGSGKSTLLWLLAGLIRPTAGQLFVAGQLLGDRDEGALAEMRARRVGVLMQNPSRNVLPYGTALDNVMFAQSSAPGRWPAKRKRALALLESVGLGGLEASRAGALSGGEQQRLAMAVAVANDPQLLLADEPTSQLDEETAKVVVQLMKVASVDLGTTVVVVTHDEAVAAAMDRTVTIRDGRIGAEGRAGQEFVVVGRDGGVHLPPEVLDLLPPGALARVARRDGVVELHPVAEEADGTEEVDG
ncbi:MAG TPA: ABC transporter ATP-binding protein [Nocardioidaceae bacterium]|nr:ABC transporter ATP-binding protein [Nocardioidaceae bacterium]